MTKLQSSIFRSPIGDICLLTRSGKLCYLDFAENGARMATLMSRRFGDYQLIEKSNHQNLHQMLAAYFAGEADAFKGVELDTGGTEFQQKVWQMLLTIPRGETLDYASLARRAGNAKAVRAAASSNARNPVSIVIPCHRVIGKDGSLRGYAGGQHRKQWLLELEGARVARAANPGQGKLAQG